jgi:hypothetical protein
MKKPRKPAKKAVKAKVPPELGSLNIGEQEQIPLDLLWSAALEVDRRLNPDHPPLLIDNEEWLASCVNIATNRLMFVRNQGKIVQNKHRIEMLSHGILTCRKIVALFLPTFTDAEKRADRVTFRRGCQLITGLKDARDAEKRFFFALKHIKLLNPKPYEHYHSKGFTLAETLEGQSALGKIPKNKIRKPYERTGNHRRNKQGRKKNPKK